MDSLEELIEKAEVWDDVAQSTLGEKYRYGDGVPKDPKEGFKWLLRSAEHGYPYAAMQVSDMYANGEGVGKNPVKAAAWHSVNLHVINAYSFALCGIGKSEEDLDEESRSQVEFLRTFYAEVERGWYEIFYKLEDDEYCELQSATDEISDIVSLALPQKVKRQFHRPKFLTLEESEEANKNIEAFMTNHITRSAELRSQREKLKAADSKRA